MGTGGGVSCFFGTVEELMPEYESTGQTGQAEQGVPSSKQWCKIWRLHAEKSSMRHTDSATFVARLVQKLSSVAMSFGMAGWVLLFSYIVTKKSYNMRPAARTVGAGAFALTPRRASASTSREHRGRRVEGCGNGAGTGGSAINKTFLIHSSKSDTRAPQLSTKL